MSSRPLLRRPYAVILALMALLVGLFSAVPAQASVTNNKNATTWTVLVGQQSSEKAIQGMRFGASDIWIDQGDAIKFVANSAEIHTVSYGTPPLPPTDVNNLLADAVPAVGGPVFDPTASWTNSGILNTTGSPDFPTKTSYVLKFAARGDFMFYCLIHGMMMSIMIHVQPPNATYPHTQTWYDEQAAKQNAAIIADGYALWKSTAAKASDTHVYVGAMDDEAMVMRFIPSTSTVAKGTTVMWDMSANPGVVPHTVTFTNLVQNGSLVDSGVLLPAFVGGPSTFSVPFDQAGTWNYFCAFHDDLGMLGSVTVQ
ncbi:plastocyanin/azurin family copper-binding protein [Microbacterium sp. ASV49]|uniref:Plastocyanin/azurin family copper-binding protein n=1 Tax=Microbacterium candidum TaxID=3041922 RepID=A0ABT7MZ55_9MICO|nr:plastocyanin/azurin family copper-binding protein [Microbacterium sp. ASV49]MDL9979735.1 plastocyanin/azurin family copper-binding protein [Microbacterium sp. ASV49]